MAQFREREQDDSDGVPIDLEERACPTCRRPLQPWEATCPDDGSLAVPKAQLGALEDHILTRLDPRLLDGADDD